MSESGLWVLPVYAINNLSIYKDTRKMTAEGTIAAHVYSMPAVASRTDTIVVHNKSLGVQALWLQVQGSNIQIWLQN